MNPTLITHLRTLLTDPHHLDLDALFAILDNGHASAVLACLAPPGSLPQIAAALCIGWSWYLEGWKRQTDELIHRITDPRCPRPGMMIATWRHCPSAVGVLRDRTNDLFVWAEQRLAPKWYDDLAILLGPSNASARLLMQSPFPYDIGITLRRWSMAISPDDPTAWQTMIDTDLRAVVREKADPSTAFPAWGWDDAVDSDIVLREIVDDLASGWSHDHPSIRGRFAWLEHHVTPDLHVDDFARVASIGRSDALAEVVCARLGHDPSSIPKIAEVVPWGRLYPQIQTVIDTTMQRSSDDRWKRTWVCAIEPGAVERAPTIDPNILLWRIDRGRWDDLDPSIRAALVSNIYRHPHCYGWVMPPDLVVGKYRPYGWGFRFWNPDVPPDDLRAWEYADLLRAQSTLQEVWDMIALLAVLSPNRRARFEQIIDWRLGGRPEAPPQPPWDWESWIALPAADRQRRLRDRLVILLGDRAALPAVRFWRARNDRLATLALMLGEFLGLDDPTSILAALLAQIPVLRGDTTDVEPSLPFPDDLDAARRAQIERLPLTPDAQAYAAWGLWLLARAGDVGADLLALHPDVAIALAPLLNADQQKAVATSPAAQGWESMTFLSWAAACAPAQEQSMLPKQRRIR